MAGRFALLLCLGSYLGMAGLAHGQRMPSPGTDFDQLLRLLDAAVEEGQPERAARLALLARSRILVRPDHTKQEALLRIFDDMATGASERARKYLEKVANLGEGIGSLGLVDDALRKVAEPLITQVNSLIETDYKECAAFVLEPLWAFAPEEALALLARIQEIRDGNRPPGDKPMSTGLRLGDAMSRGTSGAILVGTPIDDPNYKSIEELRRNSALAMVEVSQAALDGGLPWVAIDLAEISTAIFPVYPGRFEQVTTAARKELVKQRTAASKAVVTKLLKRGQKSLSQKSWRITADAVTFPTARGKPGLLVTKDPVEGDYRFAMDLWTDFEHGPQGFVFGYKSDDDFCTAIFMLYEGLTAVKIERYLKGEPQRLHWWEGPAGIDTGDRKAAWPIAFERHDQTAWLQIGNSPWIRYSGEDVDLSGSIGLYLYEKAQGKNAKASMFEFELLPEAAGDG